MASERPALASRDPVLAVRGRRRVAGEREKFSVWARRFGKARAARPRLRRATAGSFGARPDAARWFMDSAFLLLLAMLFAAGLYAVVPAIRARFGGRRRR
jgi:hypothetical protein